MLEWTRATTGSPATIPRRSPVVPTTDPANTELAGVARSWTTAPRRPRSMRRPMIPPRRYDANAPRVIPTTGAVELRPISFPTVRPPMVPAITRRSLNTSTKITLCRLTLTHC